MSAEPDFSEEAEALLRAVRTDIMAKTDWSALVALKQFAATCYRRGQDDEAKACALLHESVDGSCDHERSADLPGAAAFGAVIEYRDMIRARIAARQKGGSGGR